MNTLSEILARLTDISSWDLHGITQEQLNELAVQLEQDYAQALAQLQQREAELVNGVLDRIQESLDNHTTPEGHDLLTRSYINNTITFERERASKMGVKLQ